MLLMIVSCGFHMRGMTEISFKTISLEGKELSLKNMESGEQLKFAITNFISEFSKL